MRYTQGQVRDLLNIPAETLRRWRDSVPALAAHKGHAPTFSPGDVVALALLSDLVHVFGMRVNTVADRIDELFDACHRCSWLALEKCTVVFTGSTLRIVQAEIDHNMGAESETALVIQLQPVIERLRNNLIAAEADDPQAQLQFAPHSVSAKALT